MADTYTNLAPVANPAPSSVGSSQIADGSIVDADISSSAAITRTKVATGTADRLVVNAHSGGALSDAAAITASRILKSDANGVPTHCASTTSDTELGYVAGVTSAIQTQLGTKAARPTTTSATLANDFTINSTNYVSVTGLAVTITTPAAGEKALFTLTGGANGASSGTIWLAYSLNGGADTVLATTACFTGGTTNISLTFPLSLSSGSNTIQIRCKDQGSSFPIKIWGTTPSGANGAATLTAVQFG
jgi:hypothetical protein